MNYECLLSWEGSRIFLVFEIIEVLGTKELEWRPRLDHIFFRLFLWMSFNQYIILCYLAITITIELICYLGCLVLNIFSCLFTLIQKIIARYKTFVFLFKNSLTWITIWYNSVIIALLYIKYINVFQNLDNVSFPPIACHHCGF